MQFPTWQTIVDEYKKIHNKDPNVRKATYDELSYFEQRDIINSPITLNSKYNRLIRLEIENRWEHEGRPYYNVHPLMARKLLKTNLDKIPTDFIEVPGDFTVVCFRFAEDVPIKYTEKSGLIGFDLPEAKFPLYIRCVLFAKVKITDSDLLRKYNPEGIGKELIILAIDYGVRNKFKGIDTALCNLIRLECRTGETIPQSISRTIDSSNRVYKTMLSTEKDRIFNLFRVIISCGFLANTPEENLVVPDVLSKDYEDYMAAVDKNDTPKMTQIADRARRRGKLGWNIGTNEIFVDEHISKSSHSSELTGRELQYSHIRAGHPHAVRYGEGKDKIKIKWFRSLRVRRDLPFQKDEE